MGIKCSLFGHTFGEATVERDREEQGSEVVITIREVESCTRCGEIRVVSENKEVTSLETPENVGAPAEAATDGEPESGAVDASGTEDVEDTAVTEAGTAASAGEEEAVTGGAVTGEFDPASEDAEILDDAGSDRAPGEWPGDADADEGDEEAFDQFEYDNPEAEPTVEDDAELIDAGDDSTRDDAWPSEGERGVDSRSGPGASTVPEGEFVCDTCGFLTPVEESSLREGDFCPECREATVVQVTDDRG